MAINNFAEANDYLRQFHDLKNTKYDLVKMKKLVKHLGNPQNKLRVIHIGGTSGKTSTAYYISALLIASGYKTGLTVSPIVDEINERVQLNGQPLEESEFCKALTSFSKLIKNSAVKPSWFELMIAFAFWYFAENKVDYAVIEVGLGGLKDATNVINRVDKICVITDIGYDHTNVLGKTLSAISTQKAGIILPNNAVFTYDQGPEIMKVFMDQCQKVGSSLNIVKNVKNNITSMPDYQFRNWNLALQVYRYISNRDRLPKLSSNDLKLTQKILIPGRMDVRQIYGKTLVMDGAHNTQKISAFISSFKKIYPGVKPAILIAMRPGKSYSEVASLVSPFASSVITTTFVANQDLPISSLPASKLANYFKDKVPTISIEDQSLALKTLLDSKEEIIVITGSIYLLGQLRKKLLMY